MTRPLKIRIENSLISNNKSLLKANERAYEKTKKFFLVKSVINFYVQTFSQMLTENAPFLYLVKELVILSDKVFYNSLNFYCSSSMQKNDSSQLQMIEQSDNLFTGEHLEDYIQLIGDLLDIIKSSMSFNVQEQKLETYRVLSAMINPFMQYVIIHSSKLSSLEMTIFSFNCAYSLCKIIAKYKFVESFLENLQKQLEEYLEVLVNEQFHHIINKLSVTSFYNAILQNDQFTIPMSTLSGCDHIAVTSFLVLYLFFFNYYFLKFVFVLEIVEQIYL